MSDRMPSAGDFQERIVRRAARDDAFRQRLLAAPKATIEQELGLSLPASLEFVALEETDSRLYLVLPARSLDPGELRGDDLSAVAAGGPAGPTLDDARYAALLSEMLARIPAHTPDWTNSSDSPSGSSSSPIRRSRPR